MSSCSGDEGLEIWEENAPLETELLPSVQPEALAEPRGKSKMRGFLKSMVACKKFCHKFEHGGCECLPQPEMESQAKSHGETLTSEEPK